MPDLAVIVVTWNTRELALQTLRSLYADLKANGPSAQVIVVDSASSDGTVEAVRAEFPQARVIACSENVGFAGGNNLALRELGFDGRANADLPEAVYLLNPDTITHNGATHALYDALMSQPSAGFVGARLSYGDGSFQHSAFAFPGLRQLWVEFFPMPGRLIESGFNGRYPRIAYAGAQPFAVDCVLGATFMLRREVILQTGLFDEQFFMYCEEIDWQWRIRQAGWRGYCVPQAHVTHLGGQSTGLVRPRSLVNLWTSRLRLYAKHYAPLKLALARWLVRAGMHRRMRVLRGDTTLSPADRDALIEACQMVEQAAS